MTDHIKAMWCDISTMQKSEPQKKRVNTSLDGSWKLEAGARLTTGTVNRASVPYSQAKKELPFLSRILACIMLLPSTETSLNISHNISQMLSKTVSRVFSSEERSLTLGEVHINTHSNSGSMCRCQRVINKLYKREHRRLEAADRTGKYWLVNISYMNRHCSPHDKTVSHCASESLGLLLSSLYD